MAQLGKNHYHLSHLYDRIEVADFLANTAKGAIIGHPVGNHFEFIFLTDEFSFDKQSRIRLFHIQVNKHHLPLFGQKSGEVG